MTDLTITAVEGEPRILDTDLAVKLGYMNPRNIRTLIKRHMGRVAELGRCCTVKHRPERGGHEEERFYLNRRQALFIITQAGTETALEITTEVVRKFDAYENGQIEAKAPPLPDFTNPAIAARAWAEQFEQRQIAEERVTFPIRAFDHRSGLFHVYVS
ncbi:hypothetical protein [uncultured Rhodospira sp.]|uniref:hypothetical protein n=1 Tax=uncultured Rhodospira sp. TaxID=1936189 RepID=UPI0026386961|nr:hypothetical protein [uncultured Rhodospira sp.]